MGGVISFVDGPVYPNTIVITHIINVGSIGISLHLDFFNYSGVSHTENDLIVITSAQMHLSFDSGTNGHTFRFWNPSGKMDGTMRYQEGAVIFDNVKFDSSQFALDMFAIAFNTNNTYRFTFSNTKEIATGVLNLKKYSIQTL